MHSGAIRIGSSRRQQIAHRPPPRPGPRSTLMDKVFHFFLTSFLILLMSFFLIIHNNSNSMQFVRRFFACNSLLKATYREVFWGNASRVFFLKIRRTSGAALHGAMNNVPPPAELTTSSSSGAASNANTMSTRLTAKQVEEQKMQQVEI